MICFKECDKDLPFQYFSFVTVGGYFYYRLKILCNDPTYIIKVNSVQIRESIIRLFLLVKVKLSKYFIFEIYVLCILVQ